MKTVMADSSIGHLHIICFVVLLAWRIECTENQFCLEQEDTFQACSARMESIYLAKSQSLDILCKEIAQYLSCVHETNVSCPDMPIFQDRPYTDAVQNAMNQLTRFCKGYSISTKCNERFVNHLVSKCTTILNQVQVDIPREDMCQYSKEYLACLQRATDMCPNNTEFLLLNVPLAMASTESSLRAVCDDVQEDNPDSWIVNEKVTPHPLCTTQSLEVEARKCIRNTEHPAAEMSVNGCKHQQMFVSCLDHLLRNCPNAEADYKTMLAKAEETYSTLCSAYKCPKEIEDRDEDAVSYCMKDFSDEDPSSANYCKKLELVPECIQDLAPLCPPSHDPFRIDGTMVLLNRVFEDNCSAYKCPKEIEYGDQDPVSYCMKDFYTLKLPKPIYCIKLQFVPGCIQDLTALCPPIHDPLRREWTLKEVNRVLVDKCGYEAVAQG